MRKFWKLHGIGNDYLYFDCFENELPDPERVAVKLSARRFSVGGDGIILVGKSEVADASMRIFNADGSEGKMCGNGVRCVGKFLYDVKKIQKDVLTVETLSGIKTLAVTAKDGKMMSARVDMGKAELAPEKIPAFFDGKSVIDRPLIVGGKEYRITCVSMGNPHCVTFTEDPYALDLKSIGEKFERNAVFPERTNTEFVRVDRRNEITMRVWERGSGETWACGTGACAAAVASVLNGYCDKGEDILVHLRGGDLTICYTDETVFMTGGAELSFIGEVEL